MRRHVVALVLVVLVLGVAIGVGVVWNRPPSDLAGGWIATSVEVDDRSVLEATDSALPTLTFEEGSGGLSVSATVGCNTIGAPATYRIGGRLTFGERLSTLIGCPERLAELESALSEALGRVNHVEVDSDELELTGDGVEMSFTRLAA
jgi:heat shock protein HslJ